jgi:cytochrome P450
MSFLAFSQGPRNCIGMRFALLEIKIALIKILRSYNLKTCAETPKEFILDPQSLTSNSKNLLWVKAEER